VTSALLIIDMQVDFFNDDELERCREDLVANCNLLVERARERGVPVLEVRTIHQADGSTWALNMVEDGAGMTIEGTRGAEPADGLLTGDIVIPKTRDSAFYGTDLSELLAERGVDHLVLCGVSTEACVDATATDAYARDVRVTLVEDATASVEWKLHDQTLRDLQNKYRQAVVAARDVEFEVAGS
jgi:nicotinamidase-related amidase